MQSELNWRVFPVQELTETHIARMYELMCSHYDAMTRDNFVSDLLKKNWVSVLTDTEGLICGFSTIALNPNDTGGEDYNIFFSGDTIIDQAHWGTQSLTKAQAYTFGSILAKYPDKKLYWYLMSKGHRTYMYLPLFFKKYYPAQDKTNEDDVFGLVDRVSRILFGADWKPDLGVILYEKPKDRLKSDLAQGSMQKKHKPQVQFFLEKNPGYERGDELVCMANVHPENMKRLAKAFVEEGLKNPLSL